MIEFVFRSTGAHIVPDGVADAEVGESSCRRFLRQSVGEDVSQFPRRRADEGRIVGILQIFPAPDPFPHEHEVAFPPPSARMSVGPRARTRVCRSMTVLRSPGEGMVGVAKMAAVVGRTFVWCTDALPGGLHCTETRGISPCVRMRLPKSASIGASKFVIACIGRHAEHLIGCCRDGAVGHCCFRSCVLSCVRWCPRSCWRLCVRPYCDRLWSALDDSESLIACPERVLSTTRGCRTAAVGCVG